MFTSSETTPNLEVISKKKKKRSLTASLHLFHHFWPENATKRDEKQLMTFFFFLEITSEFGVFGLFEQNLRALTQIAQEIKSCLKFS